METRALGRSGLRVPVLCMGTMTFGLQTDEQESFRILDRALEAGVAFLDTADVSEIRRASEAKPHVAQGQYSTAFARVF